MCPFPGDPSSQAHLRAMIFSTPIYPVPNTGPGSWWDPNPQVSKSNRALCRSESVGVNTGLRCQWDPHFISLSLSFPGSHQGCHEKGCRGGRMDIGRLQVTLASYKLWTYCVPRCQQVASTDSCGAGLLQCWQAQSTKLWKPKEARLTRSWLLLLLSWAGSSG